MNSLISNRDDEWERAYYVVHWHYELMTQLEMRALNHLTGVAKAMEGRTDVQAQEEARSRPFSHRVSSDPEVLKLATEGYEMLIRRTAARIENDSCDQIRFSNCPQCGKLVRTLTAKQCRRCRHDWH